jgi:hypothetical protein
MTCQLDTWHDADLMWMTGNGHGARICGDDRWYLSKAIHHISTILLQGSFAHSVSGVELSE